MTDTLLKVISFGYLHIDGLPPEAEITLDVRRRLRDPHVDPAMRELTGLDEQVMDRVLTTPGAHRLAVETASSAEALRESTHGPVTVAVGCAGGRHRSVALAEHIATTLRRRRWEVDVEHMHVHLPVVERPVAQ